MINGMTAVLIQQLLELLDVSATPSDYEINLSDRAGEGNVSQGKGGADVSQQRSSLITQVCPAEDFFPGIRFSAYLRNVSRV